MNHQTTQSMSEAELSRQLGKYQSAAQIWPMLGLVCCLAGVAAFFLISNAAIKAILTGVLFFGGIYGVIFLGGGARKKLQELMQAQFGDFFREELEKAFGAELHSPEMRIDRACVEGFRLANRRWEEYEIADFREGVSKGMHFSAANVVLQHVYQRGNGQEGYETCQDEVFRGILLCCGTREAAPSPICISMRPQDAKDAPAALLTQKFLHLLEEFERTMGAKIIGLRWEGRVLSLLAETRDGFAAVPEWVDLSDLDALRRGYLFSLQRMAKGLDILKQNSIF